MPSVKGDNAFRTIGEVSAELGLPQHILRYWETRFPQLRPVTRAGNRRYYRPEDMVLLRRIDQALNRDGYTVKGVQQLLGSASGPTKRDIIPGEDASILPRLVEIRDLLAAALA